MQDPPQYAVVPVQTVPHPPQLCGSLPVFTHTPLQQSRPSPHAGLQLAAPPDEEPLLVPEELPLLPDPELLPLELLPLEPLLPVDASLPPGAVEPPHCNEDTSSAPRGAIHSGHFERTIMTASPRRNCGPSDRRRRDGIDGLRRDAVRSGRSTSASGVGLRRVVPLVLNVS